MDVTNAFNQIFNLIFDGFTFCFNTLDSITFRGISLLDFFIWLFVLGIIIPVIITIIPSRGISMSSDVARGAKNAARNAKNSASRKKSEYESAFDVDLDW